MLHHRDENYLQWLIVLQFYHRTLKLMGLSKTVIPCAFLISRILERKASLALWCRRNQDKALFHRWYEEIKKPRWDNCGQVLRLTKSKTMSIKESDQHMGIPCFL